MALSNAAKLVCFVTSSPAGETTHDYQVALTLQLDDRHPEIILGLDQRVEVQVGRSNLPPAARPAMGTARHWRSLNIMKVKEERQYGLFQIPLGSLGLELLVYLWPGRFFDRHQWRRIVDEVEAALGCVLWNPASVPAWVQKSSGIEPLPGLLDAIQEEVRCAQDLIRRPYEELNPPSQLSSHHLQDLPEHRLLLSWSRRRLGQVREVGRQLSDQVSDLERDQAALGANEQRREALRVEGEQVQPMLDLANRLRASLVRIGHEVEHLTPSGLELTPAIQRDHRLRRLLRAFQPTRREQLATQVAQLSGLPPLQAPRLFELWAVVWMIRCCRSEGWAVMSERPRGLPVAGRPTGWCWVLKRDGVQLIIDWEPPPTALDFKGLVPVEARNHPAMHPPSGLAPHPLGRLVALFPRTPDFIFRLIGPAGEALAIGDATLADPRFNEAERPESKVNKLFDYRRELAWQAPSGRLVTCDPLGAFVVLPGPRSHWISWEAYAAQLDCRLICPVPGGDNNSEAEDHLARLVDHLVDRVR